MSDTAIHTSILSFFLKFSSVFVDLLAIISAAEANNYRGKKETGRRCIRIREIPNRSQPYIILAPYQLRIVPRQAGVPLRDWSPPVARRTFLRKLRHRASLGSIATPLIPVLHQTRANARYVALNCYRDSDSSLSRLSFNVVPTDD